MLKFVFFIIGITSCNHIWCQNNLGAIGTWREHYNNQSVQQVTLAVNDQGEKVLSATTSFQIALVNSKNQIELIGKSNGLHDMGIACSAWDSEQSQMIIAYQNSNIDIIQGDQVYSINDLWLSNLYGNKKINDIYILHNWAFISTNFGIVVIDLTKHEIKDTWFPNNNRQNTITFQVNCTANDLYAVTENGIWTCPLKNNWATNAWQWRSEYNNIGIQKITQFNNQIYLYNNIAVYQYPSTVPLMVMNRGIINVCKASKEGVFLAIKWGSKGSMIQLKADKTFLTVIDSSILSNPKDFCWDGNNIWVADSLHGLFYKNNNATAISNWISLGGPQATIKGKINSNASFLVGGFSNNNNGWARYNEEGWKSFVTNKGVAIPVLNFSTTDPNDNSIWFTYQNGLWHTNLDQSVSEQITPLNVKGPYSDLQFDQEGVLWVLVDQQGLLQKRDNSWKNIIPPSNISLNGAQKMVVNQQGQIWIIAPNNQGVIIYNSTNNTWYQLSTINNNLPSSSVTSILEDKKGTMWVGTNNGIGLFDCSELGNCKAYLPQIKNSNGFAGLLFQKEIVNTMAVDGANQKWVGTNNGCWLLSEDGSQILQRFSKNNSPLPNDTILQICIAPLSGEVFMNTNNQLVSYRSSANETIQSTQNIIVFPNPVLPNYEGPIAMKGFVNNAIVKITTLDGKLVFQTRALGGQAIWNGKTYEGSKVASGIYLVFARDDAGMEKSMGKIIITSGGQ